MIEIQEFKVNHVDTVRDWLGLASARSKWSPGPDFYQRDGGIWCMMHYNLVYK